MQLASRRGLATLLLLAGALQARALQAGAWPAPAPQRSRRAGAPVLQQPPIGAEPGGGGAAAAEPAGSSVVALAPSLPPARGPASGEWQLDFYSRPVQGADGKKLWELLVTDSAGSFYHAEAVPSNCVNSRELRKRVQALIDASAVKPRAIRFFRAQMKNMLSIALSDLGSARAVPSRATYMLYEWLAQRERSLYPTMAGYRPPRPEPPPVRLPVKLPDQLRGEQYAFVTLPYAEFLPGGGITDENVGFGSLCPLPAADRAPAEDAMVPGLVVFSRRAPAIAAWLTGADPRGRCAAAGALLSHGRAALSFLLGVDLAYVCGALESRELLLEVGRGTQRQHLGGISAASRLHLVGQVGLDTQYLFARIRTAEQSLEAQLFEEGKSRTAGLHFLSVQASAEADAPDGFWLLKDVAAEKRAVFSPPA